MHACSDSGVEDKMRKVYDDNGDDDNNDRQQTSAQVS